MIDKSNGRLKQMMEHAIEKGQEKSLVRSLAGVLQHDMNGNKVVLTPDFVMLSLEFAVLDKTDKVILNGGIIYHGSAEDPLIRNYSTTVEQTYGWSVHT